jgi:hypothetical protein
MPVASAVTTNRSVGSNTLKANGNSVVTPFPEKGPASLFSVDIVIRGSPDAYQKVIDI